MAIPQRRAGEWLREQRKQGGERERRRSACRACVSARQTMDTFVTYVLCSLAGAK